MKIVCIPNTCSNVFLFARFHWESLCSLFPMILCLATELFFIHLFALKNVLFFHTDFTLLGACQSNEYVINVFFIIIAMFALHTPKKNAPHDMK